MNSGSMASFRAAAELPDRDDYDAGPGWTFCLECGEKIPDADDGNPPYCGRCWKLFNGEIIY